MKLLIAAIFLRVTSAAFGQEASPTPKKNPFEGWGTSLDKKPNHGAHAASPSALVPPARGSTNGLPWPVEGHVFTLTELNQYRDRIVGQVVWVKLTTTGFSPEPVNNQYKIFVSDGRSSGYSSDNYAYVWFPAEGAQKMKLLTTTSRGSLSFYVKVDKDRLTAVARSRNIDSFHNTFTYTW